MPEPLPENNSVVNQACKRALLQLKLRPSPDPYVLYLWQILEWWREKWEKNPPKPGSPTDQMLDQLANLALDKPWVMPIFEVTSEKEPSNLVHLCSQDNPPPSAQEIAQEAWAQLNDWMMDNNVFD